MSTSLVQANKLLRQRRYSDALVLYARAMQERPELAHVIKFNTWHAERRQQLWPENGNEQPIDREVNPVSGYVLAKPENLDQYAFERIVDSGLFDIQWYLSEYRDRCQVNENPLAHYLERGVVEGLNPSLEFDTCHYLENNPDVAAADIHPFVHFVCQGYWEGRLPLPVKIHPEVNHDSAQSQEDFPPAIPVIEFDETKDCYVDYEEQPAIDPAVKLIAFYLPQFHPFPENDEWWGKGFTEWTNVAKAFPNYEGHHHPHCPIHFGYYDLRVASVMEEQAALAKEYGVYGFNYYFYWFGGKTLMEAPLRAMLSNPKVDMPFCLTWANENWTRRWDGQENDVLIGQKHSREDSIAFIRYLFDYFRDNRYIKIDGKPLLVIYRANIIPDIEKTAELWREEMRHAGFPGIYLVAAQTFGIKSPVSFGFDAAVEFPPHTVSSTDVRHNVKLTNPKFDGHIFSYDQVVNNAVKYHEPEYKVFRTAMLSWDNTARKQHSGHIFHGFTLLRYKQWLASLCAHVFNNPKYANDEKLVFVNAWNEWAEGTHLEPDRKFGYAYLQTTRNVIGQFDAAKVAGLAVHPPTQRNEVAIIAHVHYRDLWPYMETYLRKAFTGGFDLYASVTDVAVIDAIKEAFPDAHVRLVENRGRDVLPFIETLRTIHSLNYTAVCKIHSKKSTYRADGEDMRDALFESLLGSEEKVTLILESFRQNTRLGMAVPEKFLIPHTDHNMTYDREVVKDIASRMKAKFNYSTFPAGSMFWFKQGALSKLLNLDSSSFEVEQGLADGTNAHAVERMFAIAVKNAGYEVHALVGQGD